MLKPRETAMVKRMPDAEWERAKADLSLIRESLKAMGLSELHRQSHAARRSLEEKRNPLQAGIELLLIAEQLPPHTLLQNQLVELANALLSYPTVDEAAMVRAKMQRPVTLENAIY